MPNEDQQSRQGMAMTGDGPAALATALAYFRTLTSHDFDQAMTYVADDIICQAPAGRLEGAAAFRAFMKPFTQILTRSALIAAFGDDEKAVVMYDTDTVPVKDAPGAEYVTVKTARSPTCGSSSTGCPSTRRVTAPPVPADPVGLDYWILPRRTSRLGSSLSDHFGCLPARALSAQLPDGADPAPLI